MFVAGLIVGLVAASLFWLAIAWSLGVEAREMRADDNRLPWEQR